MEERTFYYLRLILKQRRHLFLILNFLLPAQKAEGKAHVAIGFGCTGGQHRSVAVAEKLAQVLAEAGWQVSKRHRELERRVAPLGTDGNGVVRA